MNILVFAPHRDDEILGVGGTILKRKAAGDSVTVCVVTAKVGGEWGPLTKKVDEERQKCHEFCGIDRYVGLPFAPNVLENYTRKELNGSLLEVLMSVKPEEVYLPHWGDMQRDHRLVTEAAMVALRSKYQHGVKRIYAYETLSETGINLPSDYNAFIPNVFEDISEFLERKLKAFSFYASQIAAFPDLRSIEAVKSLAELRGATVNVKAAEAFALVREVRSC